MRVYPTQKRGEGYLPRLGSCGHPATGCRTEFRRAALQLAWPVKESSEKR